MVGQPRVHVQLQDRDNLGDLDAKLEDLRVSGIERVTILDQFNLGAECPPFLVLKLAGTGDPFDVADTLLSGPTAPFLRSAEPDVIEYLPPRSTAGAAAQTQPWHLDAMGVPDAWITLGQGEDIVVAVIDSGFCVCEAAGYATHPAAGWTHRSCRGPIEVIADVRGMPSDLHGTNCAGVVASSKTGVAPKAKVLPVAACASTFKSQEYLAHAVRHAIGPDEKGDQARSRAHIISCSLGPPTAKQPVRLAKLLEEALKCAATSGRNGLGVPIFWASDNFGDAISNDGI
jgi:thermitase